MRSATSLAAVLSMCLASLAVSARGEDVTLKVDGRTSQTPWAAALGEFVAVAFGAQSGGGQSDIFAAVSRDGGRTFAAPVRVSDREGDARLGGELPPRVGLVARPGGDPEVVVAYGAKAATTEIRVSRSTDGGRTFTASRALQAPGAAGDRGWHAMAIDGQGAAHVMWLDHRGLASSKQSPADHHAEHAAMDGVAMAERSGLYYAREGGGAVVAERELVKGVCYCCKVALASAPSGRLIAAWRHVYPGNVRDIAFLRSSDNGEHFGAPGRVSDDAWHLAGCPDDGPAIAMDANGVTHLVWPTVIDGPTPTGAIFYASSADGAAFTARVRVPTLGAPRPMHPQIAVGRDGRLYVAWDEVINATRQAAVRSLRLDGAGQPVFEEASRLGEPGTPSSYPVLVATSEGALAVYVHGQPGDSVIRVARF